MKKSKLLESKIRSILLDEDPGGVYIKELKNKDEYDLEIKRIIKLFKEERLETAFLDRVFKLMLDSFGETKNTPRYKIIAKKIWDAYKLKY